MRVRRRILIQLDRVKKSWGMRLLSKIRPQDVSRQSGGRVGMVLKWGRTHSNDNMEVQLFHRLKGALQEPLALPALVLNNWFAFYKRKDLIQEVM